MEFLRGKFITFEGADGSGKSTQLKHLASNLTAQGIPVICVREPGGTAVGEAVRHILFKVEPICRETELLLFWASRVQLLREVIAPKLSAGFVVLSDRFTDSTKAYQGIARGLGVPLCQAVENFYRSAFNLPTPSATLVFQAPTSVLLQRLALRTEQNRLDDLLQKANEFYQSLPATSQLYLPIKADQEFDAVARDVTAALNARFGGT